MGARVGLGLLLLMAGILAAYLLSAPPSGEPGAPPASVTTDEDSGTALRDVAQLAARSSEGGPTSTAAEPPEAVPEGLVVRVLDSEGAPQSDVPVALTASLPELPTRGAVTRATTGAGSGWVRLESRLEADDLPADVQFAVAIDLPLEPPVAHGLGASVPESGRIELVLPEGARAWLEPLRVQVVDVAGAPVIGADVRFGARVGGTSKSLGEHGRARTEAPDGVALFDRAEQREAIEHARFLGLEPEHEVLLGGPFHPSPRLAVPAEPSGETLRLVQPATASVRVRVSRADGSPVEDGAGASLAWFPRGESSRLGFVQRSVVAGSARFEHVGLGIDVRVGASLSGGAGASASLALAVPLVEGETREVELTLGPEYPLLVGRVLDAAGAPAPGFYFGFALDERNPAPRHPAAGPRKVVSASYHSADADGRFEIPFAGDPFEAGRYLLLREKSDPKLGAARGWVPRYTEYDLPLSAARDGRIELGDLSLADMPVVVAGRVVDEDGQGVNQAWLWLRYPHGEGRQTSWYNLSVPGSSRVSTNPDGGFEVRTLQRVRSVRLSASRKGLGASEQLDVEPGTSGLRLVLLPGEDLANTRGNVVGSVLLDEGVPYLELSLELHAEHGRRDSMAFGGGFGFEHVRPGTHRLEVRTRRTRWLLDALEGVVVRAGETTRDPRLRGIDLRGRLRRLTLLLRGPDGAPLADVQASLTVKGEGDHLTTDEAGRLQAWVRAADSRFGLELSGFVPLELDWSPDEQELVLRAR